MGESSHDSGDDLSGLMGFFFYAFIIHPVVAWILRPGRFERKKSIMYAIAFLAGIAAIKTGECRVLMNGYNATAVVPVARILMLYVLVTLELQPFIPIRNSIEQCMSLNCII